MNQSEEPQPNAGTTNAGGTPSKPERRPKPPVLGALLALGLGAVFIGAGATAIRFFGTDVGPDTKLPIILTVGTGVLILTLGALVVVFRHLGLADKREALGLPSGSIRAVIALLLILLFFITTIYFAHSLEPGTNTRTLRGITAAQLAQIPTAEIQSQTVETTTTTAPSSTTAPAPTGPVDATNAAAITAAATPEPTYIVKLLDTPDRDARDLAKQVVTAGSTLVATIAAFYFGASGAMGAIRAAGNAMAPGAPEPPKPPDTDTTVPTDHSPPPDDPDPDGNDVHHDEDGLIDACDVDWSGVQDDSDLHLLDLAIQQGVVVVAPNPIEDPFAETPAAASSGGFL